MSETVSTFCPKSNEEWRNWLDKNHQTENSVWLIYYKQKAAKPTIKYTDAVDIALCFGWIDSKVKPINEDSFMQLFSKRKPKSVWSKINKEKVRQLISKGLMTKAGYDSIEIAKKNGSWTILDEAEALIMPKELEDEFQKKPNAKAFFLGFSRSDKRNILQWLTLAKRPETKLKRITEIVELAAENQKPKQFRGNKNNS